MQLRLEPLKKLQFASDVYNESDMSKQKYAQMLNDKYLSYTKMKLPSGAKNKADPQSGK